MDKLIFVGGCPRSGTSLVQKILDNHSQIYGGPEFDFIPQIMTLYNTLNEGIVNERQSVYYDKKKLINAIKHLIEKLLVDGFSDYRIVSEKTPDNIFVFDDLIEIFPNAKFIATIRDPRSILYSFEKVNKKAKSINKDMVSFGGNLFLDLYRINRSLAQIDKLKSSNTINCFYIYYEELVRSPEMTIRNLCDYLGIDFTIKMLETSRENASGLLFDNSITSPFITNSFKENINIDSVSSWEKGMSKSKAMICSYYFKRKNVQILSGYNFNQNFVLLPFYLFYHILLLTGFIVKLLFFHPKKVLKYVAKNY